MTSVADSKLAKVLKLDSWLNLFTNLGMQDKDKRLGGTVALHKVWQADELVELYRSDDFAANIVDIPADAMTREWIKVSFDDAEGEEDFQQFLSGISAQARIRQALIWARLTGGGAAMLGVDDGQSPDKPLDLERVKTLNFLTALDRYVLIPKTYYNDPLQPNFGSVETYYLQVSYGGGIGDAQVNNLQVVVHESRLLRFYGNVLPARYAYTEQGWGDSVLTRCFEIVRDTGMSWGAMATLLQDFAQGVFKMRGLASAMLSNNSQYVTDRMTAVDMSRSTIRSVLLDADGEEFERKATPVTGLPELLDKLLLRLAAAARIPVTLLMGQAPSGLNATGDSDIRGFYDRIAAEQENYLRPALEKLVEIALRAKNNGLKKAVDPDAFTITFNPLWQATEAEDADVKLKIAQADAIYLTNQVLDPDEVAMSRFGSDTWSSQTTLLMDRTPPKEMPRPEDRAAAMTEAMTPTDPAKGAEQGDTVEKLDFDPNQPRDEHGEWSGNGASASVKTVGARGRMTSAGHAALNSKKAEVGPHHVTTTHGMFSGSAEEAGVKAASLRSQGHDAHLVQISALGASRGDPNVISYGVAINRGTKSKPNRHFLAGNEKS